VGDVVANDTTRVSALAGEHDLAAIDRRIREELPGYRLTTEAEIAERFPLIDGTSLDLYEPEFGSGEAWWVKTADVMNDGRPDIVTVATNVADPGKDMLVVLHAGGVKAIESLGGWGFGVGEGYVALVFYDKGADMLRWDGDSFVEWSTPDH